MKKINFNDEYDFLKHYKATITIYSDKEKKIPNNEVGPITIDINIGEGEKEREEEQLKNVQEIMLDKLSKILEQKGYANSTFDVMLVKVEKNVA